VKGHGPTVRGQKTCFHECFISASRWLGDGANLQGSVATIPVLTTAGSPSHPCDAHCRQPSGCFRKLIVRDQRLPSLASTIDPAIAATGCKVGQHRIQGISDEFVPDIRHLCDLEPIVGVSDGDSILMTPIRSARSRCNSLFRHLRLGVHACGLAKDPLCSTTRRQGMTSIVPTRFKRGLGFVPAPSKSRVENFTVVPSCSQSDSRKGNP
jgi:hypothetical protein